MEVATYIFLLVLAIFIYFIPSIMGRDKRTAGSIFLLNFFFGWTLLGWLIALIWAASEDAPTHTTIVKKQSPQPDKYDQLNKLKGLLDSGAITEEEYNIEKEKLLGNRLVTEWKVK